MEIRNNIDIFKLSLEEIISSKGKMPEISETGKAVLQQRYILAEAIEKWISSLDI